MAIKTELDERDRKILQTVHQHPKALIADIAKLVGIPVPTAQKRVQRLLNEDFLERVMRVVDLRSLDFTEKIRINLKINSHRLQLQQGGPIFEKRGAGKTTLLYPNAAAGYKQEDSVGTQQQLAKFIYSKVAHEQRPGFNFAEDLIVDDVEVLIGSGDDITITLHAKNFDAVGEFVVNAVRMLGGVQEATTGKVIFSVQDSLRRQQREDKKKPNNRH